MLAALRAAGPAPALAERRRLLAALAAELVRQSEAIVAAADADFGGRAAEDTLLGDVLVTLQAARRARRWLRWWARPRPVLAPLPFQPCLAWTEPVPKGVVGVMAPWNYPVQLALWPALEAVAAGNRVAIKPSEHTPRCAALLEEIVARAWGPGIARVVQGDAAVAADFAAQPWNHLVFTGGTETGRRVAGAAAPNLTPLTLELGGQCAALVLPGARLDRAAQAILAAKALNAGQTCVAPDTVLLVGHSRAAFARAARATGIAPESRIVPWQAERQARLAAGSEVLAGGPGRRCASAAMQGERFGPVLGLVECADLAAALGWLRARPAPLALSLFGASREEERRIAAESRAGAIACGRALDHVGFPNLPFGGVGGSGHGRYHGFAGFAEFSDWRARVRHGPFALARLLDPPRGGFARKLARRLVR
ncbi:aldehyde dehydrogenase family protein [Roseomonas gilardii subsp. gilardii]|uniref:aldehyde dehydrogenase family protein n=1 Tax=Roseomonas gilardii TaxID=257708 RepID=UPI001FF7C802|nr:aldehyde dehydrogenase family protein [Roseomonas gilardii]UPG74167.1 aldehyde dehydrogenase family protein [Roseomonas gilardii subsp. gilardii]